MSNNFELNNEKIAKNGKNVNFQSWISDQANQKQIRWSEKVLTLENKNPWNSAHKFYDFLNKEVNTLRAARELLTNDYLNRILVTNEATVVDVGCGMGWLSAMLSTNPHIGRIYCIDSDKNMLMKHVPEMFKIMKGDIQKIELVEGNFSPFLLKDHSVDLVVASAAYHHSEDIFGMLKETRRILKRSGKLVLLNESPAGLLEYLTIYLRKSVNNVFKILTGQVDESFQKISHVGILYDPILGDWIYSRRAWHEAITNANFTYKEIDSELRTYKNINTGNSLRHFICTPI